MNHVKGFTLLELLIVIGILAILSTTMILVINPAELLKKARDSQRLSDFGAVKTAIAFYLLNASSPSIGSTGQTYADIGSVTCFGTASPAASSTYLYVNGSGWIPINFTLNRLLMSSLFYDFLFYFIHQFID